MKITDVLVSQHTFLRTMFDITTRALWETETSAKVAAFARLAESLVAGHVETEESVFFRPLDATLKEKGRLSEFYSTHKECIALLKEPQRPMAVSEGRSRLLLAFHVLRTHFQDEERVVIPLANATFRPEAMETLGRVWLQLHAHRETPPAQQTSMMPK
ncbi:MAG: hemerythrin domain-containing protein [Verrucomicrobia bacterium]|nr:hemerythrin domain-containing protein [Verrucomicrobiota bacterium]